MTAGDLGELKAAVIDQLREAMGGHVQRFQVSSPAMGLDGDGYLYAGGVIKISENNRPTPEVAVDVIKLVKKKVDAAQTRSGVGPVKDGTIHVIMAYAEDEDDTLLAMWRIPFEVVSSEDRPDDPVVGHVGPKDVA